MQELLSPGVRGWDVLYIATKDDRIESAREEVQEKR